MKYKVAILLTLLCASFSFAQTSTPITQKEACAKFKSSVVRIDTAKGESASGFIVSPDGWIMTAAHVVVDRQTGERLNTVAVRLPDGSTPTAQVFVDQDSFVRDFALLKVDAKTPLSSLELESGGEIADGSEITIIGYPLSAQSNYVSSITTKFCLSGLVTATESITQNGVRVGVVYFQGPAIKGISGGPIISRDTGRVIGIQSQKLAFITDGLSVVERQLTQTAGTPPVIFGANGVNLVQSTRELIQVLDRHLANGLGAATAIGDASGFFAKTKRKYKK